MEIIYIMIIAGLIAGGIYLVKSKTSDTESGSGVGPGRPSEDKPPRETDK